jgi:hypothetical protein
MVCLLGTGIGGSNEHSIFDFLLVELLNSPYLVHCAEAAALAAAATTWRSWRGSRKLQPWTRMFWLQGYSICGRDQFDVQWLVEWRTSSCTEPLDCTTLGRLGGASSTISRQGSALGSDELTTRHCTPHFPTLMPSLSLGGSISGPVVRAHKLTIQDSVVANAFVCPLSPKPGVYSSRSRDCVFDLQYTAFSFPPMQNALNVCLSSRTPDDIETRSRPTTKLACWRV